MTDRRASAPPPEDGPAPTGTVPIVQGKVLPPAPQPSAAPPAAQTLVIPNRSPAQPGPDPRFGPPSSVSAVPQPTGIPASPALPFGPPPSRPPGSGTLPIGPSGLIAPSEPVPPSNLGPPGSLGPPGNFGPPGSFGPPGTVGPQSALDPLGGVAALRALGSPSLGTPSFGPPGGLGSPGSRGSPDAPPASFDPPAPPMWIGRPAPVDEAKIADADADGDAGDDVATGAAMDVDVAPSPVRFPEGDGPASVWLVQHPSDLLRMHDGLRLSRGDAARVYAVRGWQRESPVDRVLALAGCIPMDPPPLEPEEVTSDGPFVDVMGFVVPEGVDLGKIEERVVDAFTGRLGGLFQALVGQNAFHRVREVFDAAWNAAEWPRIVLRHPGRGHLQVSASRAHDERPTGGADGLNR